MPDDAFSNDDPFLHAIHRLQIAAAMARAGLNGLFADEVHFRVLFELTEDQRREEVREGLKNLELSRDEASIALWREWRPVSKPTELAQWCHTSVRQLEDVDRWVHDDVLVPLTDKSLLETNGGVPPAFDFRPQDIVREVFSVLWRLPNNGNRPKPDDPGEVKSIVSAIAALKQAATWCEAEDTGSGHHPDEGRRAEGGSAKPLGLGHGFAENRATVSSNSEGSAMLSQFSVRELFNVAFAVSKLVDPACALRHAIETGNPSYLIDEPADGALPSSWCNKARRLAHTYEAAKEALIEIAARPPAPNRPPVRLGRFAKATGCGVLQQIVESWLTLCGVLPGIVPEAMANNATENERLNWLARAVASVNAEPVEWEALRAEVEKDLRAAAESVQQYAEAMKANRGTEPGVYRTENQALGRLLELFTNGVADARIELAANILQNDSLNSNDRLTKIDAAIPFPATASAEKLGKLLGVTKQAVMKTSWWTQNRRGEKADEIGRRQDRLRDRGRQHELNQPTDEE